MVAMLNGGRDYTVLKAKVFVESISTCTNDVTICFNEGLGDFGVAVKVPFTWKDPSLFVQTSVAGCSLFWLH